MPKWKYANTILKKFSGHDKVSRLVNFKIGK